METICPYCGHKHTIKELDRDAGPFCIKCGTDMSKSSSLMSRDEEEIPTGFHYNVKKIRWLLGEAREDLVITSVMEYCDILEAVDKASQKIMKVLPLLDNMDEPMTDRFQLQIDKYNEMIGLLKEIQVICKSPGEESITEFCDFCRGVMKYRLVEIKEWYCPKCEDEPKEFPSSAEEPPIEEITPVVEWPDTDECPLSHEKHPECEGCNLEGGCTRGEHILHHRKMEEGEPTTILCPQCKQPVNRTYDHVEGGVGGGATGHYECPDPPEEPEEPEKEDKQMSNLEEAKRLLGEEDRPEQPNLAGQHPLIVNYIDHLERSATDALSLLENTEEVPHCTLTYGDGWAFCSNCKGEWVEFPRLLDKYKYCPLCGSTVVPVEEPGKEGTWITHYNAAKKKSYACSRCNAPETYDTRFCPNCGATMEDLADEPEEPEPETYDRCERCEPKCDAATPPPVEEPTDITLLPDFPEKKSNIVISAEDLEKEVE